MSDRDPYPNDDLDRLVNEADKQAMAEGVVSVRWHYPTPTERVLARWVLEARATREDDPGEAAREQARTPGNAHRRRMLNALLAAWDANPEWRLGQLVVNADTLPAFAPDPDTFYRSDADMLAGLRALVKG